MKPPPLPLQRNSTEGKTPIDRPLEWLNTPSTPARHHATLPCFSAPFSSAFATGLADTAFEESSVDYITSNILMRSGHWKRAGMSLDGVGDGFLRRFQFFQIAIGFLR